MQLTICELNNHACTGCEVCRTIATCPSPTQCIGCGICALACPYDARRLVTVDERQQLIRITVNGNKFKVPERITILKALELCGINIGERHNEGEIFAPCRTGGCFNCLVNANGKLVRACATSVHDGKDIRTSIGTITPMRIIHGPQPHTVGGKATPWWLKGNSYIEVAIWVAGCNLRCPQCQNYATTYDGRTKPVTPNHAAEVITKARRLYRVNRMAISGGEPTLNRRWLVQFFVHLKRLNTDEDARLHLDSNGTLLTPDYIDELVIEAGVTDIGVEPKGITVETFMRISGITDKTLSARYLETSWRAIEYICERHSDRVFLGVGLPYNSAFISLDEVHEFGKRLAAIKNDVQLCVLDYFPTFKRRNIKRPSVHEMLQVKRTLENAGLKTVIIQTQIGHIGP
ncbi:MAG TPA: radical SAM protein [Armatimonadetes bacterium]|nr:radical SAM protein [Armatimonadota bacterium]